MNQPQQSFSPPAGRGPNFASAQKMETTKIHGQLRSETKEIGPLRIFLDKPLGAGATSQVFEGLYKYPNNP